MIDPATEFECLKAMHESAALLKEGGQAVVLLPDFSFAVGDHVETMDLLLVPFEHSGYVTRLFFQRKIDCRGSNWTRHRVVDQDWHAPSWNNVPATLAWTDMLCAHLRAVA